MRVLWKAFILRDEDPAATFNDYRLGHWARANAYEPETRFVPWQGDARFPTWGVPALVGSKAAERQGKFDAFHLACFKAMFTDSLDISDPAVLVAIAREVGCDPERFAADLADRALPQAVLEEHREAVERYGVRAIPTVVIGDRLVEGAVPEDVYARAIDAVRAGMAVASASGPADVAGEE